MLVRPFLSLLIVLVVYFVKLNKTDTIIAKKLRKDLNKALGGK